MIQASRCAIFVCFITLSTAAPAQKLGTVPKRAPTKSAPKGEVLEWTSAAGRPYWYRLPKKTKGKPALILMLHGTGGNHGWSFWNYPIANGTFRKHDIVLSPDGLTPGGNNTFNFTQSKPDGEQLAGIIKTFRRAFDLGKVYVYGHSQGAFFSYWFAGAYPELIDGIVAHAGNVLEVRHSKLAKQKLGIAILHGRADAVVPVSCAERSHKIYKDAGYQKLKLEIVDGLTARSGHWPLPTQVAELLTWLDSVTADTAASCIAAALAAIGRDESDFATAQGCARRGRKLLKKVKGPERDTLQQQADALQKLFETTAAAHAKALASADPKSAVDADWIEHFRIAHATYGKHSGWSKPMKPLLSRAKKDEKRVQRALKAVHKKWNKAAFKAARDAAQKALFAVSHGALLREVQPRLKSSIKGVDPAEQQALEAWIQQALERDQKGAEAAAATRSQLAEAFVESHPSWFPEG